MDSESVNAAAIAMIMLNSETVPSQTTIPPVPVNTTIDLHDNTTTESIIIKPPDDPADITKSVMEVMEEKRKSIRYIVFEESKKMALQISKGNLQRARNESVDSTVSMASTEGDLVIDDDEDDDLGSVKDDIEKAERSLNKEIEDQSPLKHEEAWRGLANLADVAQMKANIKDEFAVPGHVKTEMKYDLKYGRSADYKYGEIKDLKLESNDSKDVIKGEFSGYKVKHLQNLREAELRNANADDMKTAKLKGLKEMELRALKETPSGSVRETVLHGAKEVELRSAKGMESRGAWGAESRIAWGAESRGAWGADLRGAKEVDFRSVKETEFRSAREAEFRGGKEAEIKSAKEVELRGVRDIKGVDLRGVKVTEFRGAKSSELRSVNDAKSRNLKEAELRAIREAELRRLKEAEFRALQEAASKRMKEAEAKAMKEIEEKRRLKEAAELKFKQETEFRRIKEAELKARQEAELKRIKEAEFKLMQETKFKSAQEAELRRVKGAEMRGLQESEFRSLKSLQNTEFKSLQSAEDTRLRSMKDGNAESRILKGGEFTSLQDAELRSAKCTKGTELRSLQDAEFRTSRGVDLQNIKDAEIRGVKGAGLRNLKDAEFRNIKAAESRSIKHTDLRSVQGSDLRGLQDSELRGLQHAEYRSSRDADLRCLQSTEFKSFKGAELSSSQNVEYRNLKSGELQSIKDSELSLQGGDLRGIKGTDLRNLKGIDLSNPKDSELMNVKETDFRNLARRDPTDIQDRKVNIIQDTRLKVRGSKAFSTKIIKNPTATEAQRNLKDIKGVDLQYANYTTSGAQATQCTDAELRHRQAESRCKMAQLNIRQAELKVRQSELKYKQLELRFKQAQAKYSELEYLEPKYMQSKQKYSEAEMKHRQVELKNAQAESRYTETELRQRQVELEHAEEELRFIEAELKLRRAEMEKSTDVEVKHPELTPKYSEMGANYIEMSVRGQKGMEYAETTIRSETGMKYTEPTLRVEAGMKYAETNLRGKGSMKYTEMIPRGEAGIKYAETTLRGEAGLNYAETTLRGESGTKYAETILRGETGMKYPEITLKGEVTNYPETTMKGKPGMKYAETILRGETGTKYPGTTVRGEAGMKFVKTGVNYPEMASRRETGVKYPETMIKGEKGIKYPETTLRGETGMKYTETTIRGEKGVKCTETGVKYTEIGPKHTETKTNHIEIAPKLVIPGRTYTEAELKYMQAETQPPQPPKRPVQKDDETDLMKLKQMIAQTTTKPDAEIAMKTKQIKDILKACCSTGNTSDDKDAVTSLQASISSARSTQSDNSHLSEFFKEAKVQKSSPKKLKLQPKKQEQIPRRPSRKTKEAANVYMEILGHKLEDDNISIDSFPELPNVKKMEQRENELKKANEERLEDCKRRRLAQDKKKKAPAKRGRGKKDQSSDSDESFVPDVKMLTEKTSGRQMRVKSPKLYKSFSDTDSDSILVSRKVAVKRKSDNISPLPKPSVKKKPKKDEVVKNDEESFGESDEEPLVKLQKKTVVEEVVVGKQKRECAKRPQNYLPLFSSSDEEEKYFHGFVKSESPPKPLVAKPEPVLEIGRRYGKEKVNMSNEQIEKWLNDSVLAGMCDIKKENDEMLKFGEKIPTETSLDVSKLKPVEKTEKKVTPPEIKPMKTIFRKVEKPEPFRHVVAAFSVCNESSVYAFEADNEDSISTPFRRPSRRPSSTATSKSEDFEADQSKFRHPNIPLKSNKPETSTTLSTDESNTSITDKKPQLKPPLATSTPMCPPAVTQKKLPRPSSSRSFDRLSENSEDFKYKIPSSPSASSSSSAKLYKTKQSMKQHKPSLYSAVNVTEFPRSGDPARIVEAPVFHPTEKEFSDPLEYIEKIRAKAEKFGICRIVPPPNFKPECKVLDEMRFTAYNQYVHKMMHRWGPNFRELVAIRKYLATQSISLKHPPWIGGMEVDLPRLYQTVQTLGGLKEVIEKKKWPKVSELMKIPKSAQDRVTKLDDIYCKYLLPYDTLSPDERDKLFDSVETEWAKRESRSMSKLQQSESQGADNDEADEKKTPLDEDDDVESEEEDETDIECIVKGRSMALNAFYRIARNTMSTWFKSEPAAHDVEEEFWKHVTTKQYHICVHSGSIDSGNWGYGFAVTKNSPFARHSWNLKVLTNNSGSVLRYLGPVMGLTVPTLHVGMVFSGCCWYRDPHSLPWIEYLHTGADKIWYGIPDTMGDKFHQTLLKLVPNYCLNKSIWLPSDTAMLPPNLLVDNGVSLTRTVQQPGQFMVIFPKAFTSNICGGYVVSESVFFAPPDWLNTADDVFNEMKKSCEPSMFSHERLLLSMATDSRTDVNVLRQIIPAIDKMVKRELRERGRLRVLGVVEEEKLPLPDNKKKKKHIETEVEYVCEDCRWNLFCSMVCENQENIYCLEHAIEHLQNKKLDIGKCKLLFTYDSAELNGLVDRVNFTIETKLHKKTIGKYHGMATLLV